MSEADIKLRIVRLIDSLNGEALQELYELIINKLYQSPDSEDTLSELEQGYQEMAADEEREAEAFDWIEGTLDSDSL